MLYTNNGRVPCRLKSAGGQMWVLRPNESIEVDEDMVAPAFISKTEKRVSRKSAEKAHQERSKKSKAVWKKKESAPAKDQPKSVWKKKKSSPDEDDPKTTKE